MLAFKRHFAIVNPGHNSI